MPRERRDDAFRAYAYFRWVDDLLDGDALSPQQRLSFLASQKELLSECLQGQPPRDLSAEEWLLVDLTQGSLQKDAGLRIYLQGMMAVMDFDVQRRDQRISQQELGWYSRRLAIAVTEAVYTFIGDRCGAPRTAERYLAADAAHIVHMLRDLHDDLDAGYINIPADVLGGEQIDPAVVESASVRTWVRERVETARTYFAEGKAYLALMDNPRCRMAGALYAARFEGVLDAIEREGYRLRRDYSDCKGERMMMHMAWSGLMAVLADPVLSHFTVAHAEPIRAAAWEQINLTQILREDSLKE
ncbi:MAG: squalene/phytoene synthase family protein [Anaerolineales bacterium]|nr:squalene/phytoene synthase family protein [Anaerolineales bacterium]